MVSLVRKARDAGAEVLAGGGYTDDGILMAKAALSLKWAPKAIWHMADFGYPDFGGAREERGLAVRRYRMAADRNWPGNKQFVEAFRKEFSKEPEWLAAAGYGAARSSRRR